MSAIYKRELRAFFSSPIGYIFVAVFFAVNGALFNYMVLRSSDSGGIGTYYMTILFLFIIIIPLLTMKLFSDERRQHTEQLLLSAPVRLGAMVCGKFFAAYTVFAGTFLLSELLGMIPLYTYGSPNTALLLGNTVGILLIGAAFVAMGTFFSSLTESQLVSALVTMFFIALLLLVSMLNSYIDSAFVRTVLNWISIFSRFYDFSYGIFNFTSLFYYASIVFVFLFLTVRVYEKKRWA
jgi:ABC-2 type transport system permease protein